MTVGFTFSLKKVLLRVACIKAKEVNHSCLSKLNFPGDPESGIYQQLAQQSVSLDAAAHAFSPWSHRHRPTLLTVQVCEGIRNLGDSAPDTSSETLLLVRDCLCCPVLKTKIRKTGAGNCLLIPVCINL